MLLPVGDVQLWWDHLKTVADNRKRGAEKAAKSRKEKKAAKDEDQVFCIVCREPFVEFTQHVQSWIQCDCCNGWSHFVCSGVTEVPKAEFFCQLCKDV